MTKYTKQAIIELAIAIVISGSAGLALAASVTLFGLSNVITGLGIAVFLFCSYKYVKTQAEINERLDKLNDK
jgi:hypothetical protein